MYYFIVSVNASDLKSFIRSQGLSQGCSLTQKTDCEVCFQTHPCDCDRIQVLTVCLAEGFIPLLVRDIHSLPLVPTLWGKAYVMLAGF